MQQDIYIGTLVQVKESTVEYLKQIIPYGFESFAFTFGHDALTWMEPVQTLISRSAATSSTRLH